MGRITVQFGGIIGTVARWSNTLSFELDAPIANLATTQAIATAIQAACAASTPVKGGFGSDTTMVAPKVLAYPTDGGTAEFVATGVGAAITGTIVATHPPQICAAASLRSDLAGRSHRGRIYVPYRSSNISLEGVLSAPGQAAVAAYAQGLNDAVITAVASQAIAATWVIYSRKLVSSTPVSAILVGNQCDTIRHRNENRDEVYAVTPVTATAVTPADDAQDELFRALQNGKLKTTISPPSLPGPVKAFLDILPIPS